MNKSELIVFRYKQAPDLDFQDTYLASSAYGLKLGLEFSGDPTNVIQVGSVITIDKTNKTINTWADGEATVIGIEPSSIFPPPGKLIFTSRDLQLPIVFSSGEDGSIGYINENSEYQFYTKLDLTEDNVLPLTFSVADIRDPSKRNTSFSKTITLPGTKDNNKFFKQIYEVGADDSFNANLKVNAVLYTEGQEQLNGVLQLKKIIRTDYKSVSYEINLFGEFSNIFYNLGELALNELSLGEYNHNYSFANIRNSWDTKIVKNGQDYINWTTGYTTTFTDTTFVNGYVGLTFASAHSFQEGDYVFIDKDDKTLNNYYDGTCIVIEVIDSTTIVINKPWGSNSNNESGTIFVKNPTGEGYVYPYLTYGNNSGLQNRATQKDFLPAVYVKTIIDKIFQYAGFTYESNFFNTPYFKRLIVPFTSDYLVRDTFTLQVQEFKAGLSANTQNFLNFNLNQVESFYLDFPIDFSSTTTPDCYDNLEINTGGNDQNYFPSLPTGSEPSGRYISSFVGNQSFQVDFSFKLYYDAIELEPLNFDNVVLSQNDGTTPFPMTVRLKIYKKSLGEFTVVGQNEVIVPYPLTPIPISGQTLPTIYNMSVQALDVVLDVNDEVFVELETVAGNGLSVVRPENNTILNVGGKFGVIGMPNCRFYNIGSSNKLEANENVDLGLSLPSSIKCKDFFINIVKLFNLYVDEKKGETNKLRIEPRDDYYTLGQKIDWSKKLDISKSFDITPLAELTAKDFLYTYKEDKDYWNTDYTTLSQKIYGQYSFTTDNEFLKNPNKNEVIFSPSPQLEYGTSNISVVELKTKSENNGSITYNKTKSNIRILFYGGLKTYKGWDLNDGNFRLKFGAQSERLYPYAGMEDDPYIYYNSLCFGFPDFWYYQRPAGFNNTIFNKFFRNQITEITDADSKSVSVSIYLTPSDINILDFRNLIYINGIYYRLNKISDYNPLLNQSTKVELLKVNDLTYFQSKFSDNTNGNNDGDPDKPVDKNPSDIFTRPVFDNQQLVLGRNNNISSTSDTTVVVGNDNQIYQDSKNILILGGNNNRIGGGLNNIQLIGVDNAVVNDNNTIVLGSLISKDGVIIQNVNVLQGGFYDNAFSAITTYQTVFSYSSPLNPVNVINGIEDAAAYVGSPLNIDVFDASKDIPYQI